MAEPTKPVDRKGPRPGRQLDGSHCAHRRLPDEITKLEKAVAYFTEQGDNGMLATLTPQLAGARHRLEHADKAAELVDKLGLDNEVNVNRITYNDAVNYVAKALHEHEQHVTGEADIKSTYERAGHGSLVDVNDGDHVEHDKLECERDTVAEIVEHLGLTDAAHIAAVSELVASETKVHEAKAKAAGEVK